MWQKLKLTLNALLDQLILEEELSSCEPSDAINAGMELDLSSDSESVWDSNLEIWKNISKTYFKAKYSYFSLQSFVIYKPLNN